MIKKGIRFLPAFFSLLLSAGTASVFKACNMKEDGTWMHCHSVQNAVVLCGVILFVVFIAAAVIKKRELSIMLNVVGLAGCMLIFFLPGTIMPMCMMHSMRCYLYMQPYIRIISVLAAVCALCVIFSSLKKEQ